MVTWSEATAYPRGQGAGLEGEIRSLREQGIKAAQTQGPLLERLSWTGPSTVGGQRARWDETTRGILSRRRGGLAGLRALAAGATMAGAGGVMALLAAHLDGSWLA